MNYNYYAKQDYYAYLSSGVGAWELLLPISSGVVKGMIIVVIEVDDMSLPTGNQLVGIVFRFGSDNMIVNNNSSYYAYCNRVSQGIGRASIGGSFIIT
jgi:hypothetical protein